MRIASLYRYPVKGLSPERLEAVALTAGGYFPGDRLFAIENGPSGFDPAEPVHQPKLKYLMLMRNEALARLRTRYLDESGELAISHDGKELRANTASDAGRAAITAFFQGFMPSELRGEPRLLTAPQTYRFTDSRSGFVSIINLASIADLEQRIGAPVDPLRFRGNIMVEGLAPWAEFDLVPGQELAGASGLRLQVIKRIDRCAATNVDPQTGIRDMQIPKALVAAYGHFDCGIYCRITASGTLSEGESLEPLPLTAETEAS
jgi:uncharacterized protein